MCSTIIGYKNWWSYGHPKTLFQMNRGILGTCGNQYQTITVCTMLGSNFLYKLPKIIYLYSATLWPDEIMSPDFYSINGLRAPIFCLMERVTPKSEKFPALVIRRLISSQVGINVVGLLYREELFCFYVSM